MKTPEIVDLDQQVVGEESQKRIKFIESATGKRVLLVGHDEAVLRMPITISCEKDVVKAATVAAEIVYGNTNPDGAYAHEVDSLKSELATLCGMPKWDPFTAYPIDMSEEDRDHAIRYLRVLFGNDRNPGAAYDLAVKFVKWAVDATDPNNRK